MLVLTALISLAAALPGPARADYGDDVAYGHGKPATSIKITDPTTMEAPAGRHLFLKGDASLDVPAKGALGFSASLGYLWDYVFVDALFSYYNVQYGAVRQYQPAPVDPSSQLAFPRPDSASDSIIAIGPGVGYMMKLFGSAKWVQSGRAGLSYMQVSDSPTSSTFRGGLLLLHAEVGYRLADRLILAPGVTYNFGFTKGTNAPGRTTPDPHDDFMPFQWWSWQVGVYVWL